MVEIIKRKKALSVSPLKASQPLGASLAFLGFQGAMPMLHGSQGCTAFGKVFFVRHFREPVPLQTTAMDQISSIMGADENVVVGLKAICEKNAPALIGVPSTGLSETQGSDFKGAIKTFYREYPQYASIPIVPVSTPDFSGCLETGFAKALEAILDKLVPTAEAAGTRPGKRRRQINVLVNASLTPGDLEAIRELVEAFGLRPVLVPDLSDSLDGHLDQDEFSALSTGGCAINELATLGDATATLVIGESLSRAADLLKARTGVPDFRFSHLMGLKATDALVHCLWKLTGESVSQSVERQRSRLQDAMLDSHFMLGMSRIAIAAEPDLLIGLSQFLAGMGMETVAAVSPINTPGLQKVATETVQVGDLEDLEKAALAGAAELLITNSHGVESAKRLDIPLLRAGFPQYDVLGGFQKTWVGYEGGRQILFELANLMLELEKGEIHPYRSIYAQKPEYQEAS